jgi:hypothetical protein
LEPTRLEITNLFRGAFLLCMGGHLADVRIRNNGKRMATFLITGKDLERLDGDYRAGRALVSPVQLREALNHAGRDVRVKSALDSFRLKALSDRGLRRSGFFFTRRFSSCPIRQNAIGAVGGNRYPIRRRRTNLRGAKALCCAAALRGHFGGILSDRIFSG